MKNLLLISLILSCLISNAQQLISGFSSEQSEKQSELESTFDSLLNADNIDTWVKRMSARPHHVGSPYTLENVKFMESMFKEWGYETEITEYQVLFPTPKLRLVELVSPTRYKAKLFEEAFKSDPATGQRSEQLPPYNAFSIDGDVTAELVFVNYGIPADYEKLEQMGVDVKGKIVIAKYAGSWRGIKPKLAAEKGAIGCLIYSDPMDDGYFRGDTYPKGAFKPETGVQRGAVLDLPLRPGDPLTPYYGATKDAERLSIEDAETLTKIPVLPISYKDALPLLKALGGQVVPNQWKGALPITYHTGPGPAKVHLKLEFNWELQPAYNIIAKLKGSQYPDQWVIRGNHHDAWVHGASDPVSGMAALMEEARVVGELAKQGNIPKRTIVYCGWDAEEPGLLGSTEWVEDHADELKNKAVIYINTDGNSRGFVSGGGSHSLERMWNEVINDVPDPQKDVSIAERRWARDIYSASPAGKKVLINNRYQKLGALGSGSDYSPFFQHLGIPSLNIGFGGESSGGEYHTIYDTYKHYSQFKDPGFKYGIALAKTTGRITMRTANSERLPFYFSTLHSTINGYIKEVIELADQMRQMTEVNNSLVDKGVFEKVKDPRGQVLTFSEEKAESVPHFDFSPLLNAIDNLELAVAAIDINNSSSINEKLYKAEQQLMLENGLPRRPWFRHSIYAPGFYTGYGVKTLPGIRESIEERDWESVQEQINIVAEKLNNLSSFMTK